MYQKNMIDALLIFTPSSNKLQLTMGLFGINSSSVSFINKGLESATRKSVLSHKKPQKEAMDYFINRDVFKQFDIIMSLQI